MIPEARTSVQQLGRRRSRPDTLQTENEPPLTLRASPEHLRELRASVQLSSVAPSCPALCDPMDRSTPGLPVHHQLPEFTHVHRIGDAIQPSQPLSSPSPAFNLSPASGRVFSNWGPQPEINTTESGESAPRGRPGNYKEKTGLPRWLCGCC